MSLLHSFAVIVQQFSVTRREAGEQV